MDTSKRLHPEREKCFPKLFLNGYGVTSPEDDRYNCIAWAAGEENTNKFWTPFVIGGGYYWPEDEFPKDSKIDTFVKLYALKGGYISIDNESDSLEEGIEKVAIYADSSGDVTHAARQKSDGVWTSKLGDWEDIEHKATIGLASSGNEPAYGNVVKILRRDRRSR